MISFFCGPAAARRHGKAKKPSRGLCSAPSAASAKGNKRRTPWGGRKCKWATVAHRCPCSALTKEVNRPRIDAMSYSSVNTCVLLVLLVITLPLLHRRNRRHTPLIKVRLPCLKLGLIFNPGEQSQRHTLNATGVSTPRMDGGDYAAYAYCTWLHTSPRKFACAHVTVTIDLCPAQRGRLTLHGTTVWFLT